MEKAHSPGCESTHEGGWLLEMGMFPALCSFLTPAHSTWKQAFVLYSLSQWFPKKEQGTKVRITSVTGRAVGIFLFGA